MASAYRKNNKKEYMKNFLEVVMQLSKLTAQDWDYTSSKRLLKRMAEKHGLNQALRVQFFI